MDIFVYLKNPGPKSIAGITQTSSRIKKIKGIKPFKNHGRWLRRNYYCYYFLYERTGLLIVSLWIMILIYLWVLCGWGLGHLPTSVDIVQSSSWSLHADKINKSKCPIIKLITKAKQEPIFEEEEEAGPREVFVFALHCHFDEGQGSTTYIIVYCLTWN